MPDWPLPMVQGLKSAARLKEVEMPARVSPFQDVARRGVDARNDIDLCHECCSLSLRLQIPLVGLELAHPEAVPCGIAAAVLHGHGLGQHALAFVGDRVTRRREGLADGLGPLVTAGS